MVIVDENHSQQQVIGNAQMPYLNSLASRYGLATRWNDLSHPSLPNYLGLISGSVQDDPHDTTPADRTYPGPTVVDQLARAGYSWKAYIEDMPQPCDLTATYSPGNYDVNHNPFAYFDSVRRDHAQCDRVVPFTQFGTDLRDNTAPDFIWVSPNLINDMHNGNYAQGDGFLRQQVSVVLASSVVPGRRDRHHHLRRGRDDRAGGHDRHLAAHTARHEADHRRKPLRNAARHRGDLRPAASRRRRESLLRRPPGTFLTQSVKPRAGPAASGLAAQKRPCAGRRVQRAQMIPIWAQVLASDRRASTAHRRFAFALRSRCVTAVW